MTNTMHKKNIKAAGKSLKEAKKALIMVHGRGADARDILGLASHFNVSEYTLLAPEATNRTWYPYSFIRSEEHTSELQSRPHLVCRLLLEKINEITTLWECIITYAVALC